MTIRPVTGKPGVVSLGRGLYGEVRMHHMPTMTREERRALVDLLVPSLLGAALTYAIMAFGFGWWPFR